MEVTKFLTWLIAITLIAGVGIGSMVWAYWGSGSKKTLFTQPVDPPEGLQNSLWQEGIDAYSQGRYRLAIEKFSQLILLDPDLAQAYHNLGLTYGNFRQANQAALNLLKAGELYDQQGNKALLDLVKEQLTILRADYQKK